MDRPCAGLIREKKRIHNFTPLPFRHPSVTYETPRNGRVIVKKLQPHRKVGQENWSISRNKKIEKVILKRIVNNLSGS